MISVIICSADAGELEKVKENIAATIGVPYEIISSDNSDGRKGICEVYNNGVAQAKYETLCFMHEDIEMKTENWGRKVIEIFDQDSEIGLIGIAGGGYKSLTPSGWYNYHLEENGGFYCNLIQGYKYAEKPDKLDYRNPNNALSSGVACIDGCWFCTRKKAALQYPFDQNLLKKFHGYDLDFSLAISQSYKAVVTFEVLLKHFSEGKFDKVWMDEVLKVHKKWAELLPVNKAGLAENRLKQIERNALEHFMQQSLNTGYYTKAELAMMVWRTRESRIATLSFPFKLWKKLYKMKRQTDIF